MSGKQKADPIPASTYAGFAAEPPGATKDDLELRLNGEGRTYARADLRRRTTRRHTPVAAFAVLAVVLAGAGVGFALLHRPQAEFAAPPPPPPEAEAIAAAPTPPSPPPAEPAVAAQPAKVPAAAPRPLAHLPASPRTPPAGMARSSAQQAADRAATDQVSARAALDQEVAKAYAQALNSGAPRGPLAEAQANWVVRRDRVQHEDPEMAEDLARARIAELQALAAKPAPDQSPPGPPAQAQPAEGAEPSAQ